MDEQTAAAVLTALTDSPPEVVRVALPFPVRLAGGPHPMTTDTRPLLERATKFCITTPVFEMVKVGETTTLRLYFPSGANYLLWTGSVTVTRDQADFDGRGRMLQTVDYLVIPNRELSISDVASRVDVPTDTPLITRIDIEIANLDRYTGREMREIFNVTY